MVTLPCLSATACSTVHTGKRFDVGDRETLKRTSLFRLRNFQAASNEIPTGDALHCSFLRSNKNICNNR